MQKIPFHTHISKKTFWSRKATLSESTWEFVTVSESQPTAPTLSLINWSIIYKSHPKGTFNRIVGWLRTRSATVTNRLETTSIRLAFSMQQPLVGIIINIIIHHIYEYHSSEWSSDQFHSPCKGWSCLPSKRSRRAWCASLLRRSLTVGATRGGQVGPCFIHASSFCVASTTLAPPLYLGEIGGIINLTT